MLDADGDSWPANTNVTESLTSPGAGYRRLNLMKSRTASDCNDADIAKWQNLSGYPDADGDGYTTSVQSVCSGASLPAGYLTLANGNDCNDADATRWRTVWSSYQGRNVCVGHYISDSGGNAIGQYSANSAGPCSIMSYVDDRNGLTYSVGLQNCPSSYTNATFYYADKQCGVIPANQEIIGQTVSGAGTAYSSCSFTFNAPTQLCNGDSFYYSFSSVPSGAYTFITRTWGVTPILQNYLEGQTNVTNRVTSLSGQSDGSYQDYYAFKTTSGVGDITDCHANWMTWSSGGANCTSGRTNTTFYSSAAYSKNPGINGGNTYYAQNGQNSQNYWSTLSASGACSTDYKAVQGPSLLYYVNAVTPACGASDCYYQP